MNTKAELIAGTKMFLAGVQPQDMDATMFPEGSPVRVAIDGGGEANIGGVVIPVPPKTLDHLNCFLGWKMEAKKPIEGTMVDLPKHLARAQMEWQKVRNGFAVNAFSLLSDYSSMLLEEIARDVDSKVMRVSLPGVQAQAVSLVSLKVDEVGVHPRTMTRISNLIRTFANGKYSHDLDLRKDNLNGLKVIVARYPAAGEHSFRRVILRDTTCVEENKIALNPSALNFLHRGDTDGDIIYILIDNIAFVNGREIGADPRIVVREQGK